jgi:hypothetical protein
MNARLAIDSKNQLQEIREIPDQPTAIRRLAKIVSVIFHPVFVPVFVIAFILYIHPYLFAGFTKWNRSVVLIQAFVMFTFFPLVTVLLLKALKFINTIYLHTQKDRIIPFVACGIWYFWIWYVWRNLPDYPHEAVIFPMAIWIASSLGLLANIYLKISLHAISMGVMLCFFIYLALSGWSDMGLYLSIAIFITGLVTTSRLLISDHTQKEIYLGLLLGIISQLIAIVAG